MVARWIQRTALAVTASIALSAMPMSAAAQSVEEHPSALAMAGDLVVVRPLMFGVTVLGSVVYLLSLPFSLAGGNAEEAAQTLVMEPAKVTFVRCLGCTRSGYNRDVVELGEH